MDALEHAVSIPGGGTMAPDVALKVKERTLLGLNFLVRASAIYPQTWPLIPAGNPTIQESIAHYRESLRAGTTGAGTVGTFETLIVEQGWLPARARGARNSNGIGRIYWAWGHYLQNYGNHQQANAVSDGEDGEERPE